MKTQESNKNNWLDKQAAAFDESRFGAMTIMMTAQSCLGSIAAMYALLIDSMVLTAVCAALTMISNSAFIAQSPAKWCLVFFYTSVLGNLLILLFALLVAA